MDKTTITKEQARRFLLSHQGLWPPRSLSGQVGVMAYLNRVRCIQFDPLNIVGHNPELVLQSRVADFRPVLLQNLLYRDRQFTDAWDKQMSIILTEDWPCFQRLRTAARLDSRHCAPPVTAVLPAVRREIGERGPLSSLDLDFDARVDWHWAPTRVARAALESMYFWGELIIHHKVHTRKVYDFAANHLSPQLLSTPDPNPDEPSYHDWYIQRRLGSVGLLWGKTGDAWLGIAGLKTGERSAALERLRTADKITAVRVEGTDTPFYLRREDRPALAETLRADIPPAQAAIIAPLDNLLWDRKMLSVLFDFEYRWEVYKPESERRYGYYVLPVLYGDRFVARFEPGQDKSDRAMLIKNWWWEPGVARTEDMDAALGHCFREFLRYLGADTIRIDSEIVREAGLDWLPEQE